MATVHQHERIDEVLAVLDVVRDHLLEFGTLDL